MKNLWFLISAYSAIWILVGYYYFNIGRKVEELNKKIDVLSNK